MSQYTSGELAKLAGVTVRTVQYYDTRGILIPSDFSEGGRRLYNDGDLRKLRIICFLRDMGISINSISEILETDNAEKVISVLLEQQLEEVRTELAEKEKQKNTIETLQREIRHYKQFSIENIGDIASKMKTRKELRKIHMQILGIGMMGNVVEYTTLIIGIVKGEWLPLVIALCLLIPISVGLVRCYYNNVCYVCPECHEVYRPSKWEFFWAKHTPTTRKLTCTACGHLGFCIEVYQPIEKKGDRGHGE